MKRLGLFLLAVVMVASLVACEAEIKTDELPPGAVGIWYDFTIEVKYGHPSWDIRSGTMPPGLEFSEGRIYGYPLKEGTYPLEICNYGISGVAGKVEDCKDFILTIYPAP